MATREQREAAVKAAVLKVHSWPAYMHSVTCGCALHVRDSYICSCQFCENTRQKRSEAEIQAQ
jgi:hypothetical protein